MRKLLPERGFTLVELLVVIAIIAVLSVIGIVVFSGVQKSARDARRRSDLSAIAKALEVYKLQNSTYTPSTTFPCASAWGTYFTEIYWGVQNTKTGCMASLKSAWANYFAGSIPNDPLCPDTASCNPSDPSRRWLDYYLDVTTGGNAFTLSALLENAPNPSMTGCAGGRNYCIKNQQ